MPKRNIIRYTATTYPICYSPLWRSAWLSCRNRADRNHHYPVECKRGLKIITEKHAGLQDHINITLFNAMQHFNISTTVLFLLCLKSVFLTFKRLINVSKGKVSFLLNLRNMGCYWLYEPYWPVFYNSKTFFYPEYMHLPLLETLLCNIEWRKILKCCLIIVIDNF